MNIGIKLKELRLSKGLTQEAFANKFFVKENTISNYENNMRTPSFEFLSQVCKEFGLTLDYFENGDQIESNSEDLIVTKKHNKEAIFDTKHSSYLTPHIYEHICLSKYGYHLVFNRNDKGIITYSAMIDNLGKVTEYEGMLLGNNGTFDKFGNIPAFSKKLEKVVLMNFKGEILSMPYTRIQRINVVQNTPKDNDYGLYFGLTTDDQKDLCLKDLLDVNGKIIDLTLEKDSLLKYEIKEFYDIEVILKNIDKYGIGMIYFIPEELFKIDKVYLRLLDYAFNKIQTCTKENCLNELANLQEITQFLINKQKRYQIELKNFYGEEKLDQALSVLDDKFANKIELNFLKRNLKMKFKGFIY